MNNEQTLKTIILDDDPTGTQTVYGYKIYTDFKEETIRHGLSQPESAFFLLTNSRSLTEAQTIKLHTELGEVIKQLSFELNVKVQIISRSDSSLRQHYPIETKALVGANHDYQGEIIIPALIQAGRITIDDIHYQLNDGNRIRCDETDYANDKSFGYKSSNLREWIEEKTKGEFTKEQVRSIPLSWLKTNHTVAIREAILSLDSFNKLIVNAETLHDIKVFIDVLKPLLETNKYMIRSAASFVGVYLGCDHERIVPITDLLSNDKRYGGLIVVGSHVLKTTAQLKALRTNNLSITTIEFNQHLVMNGTLHEEAERVIVEATHSIIEGRSVLIATRRDRLDFEEEDADQQLMLTATIAYELMRIVRDLPIKPSYLIAKGGITSSDIATQALSTNRAEVIGQALNCVPVWRIIDGKYNSLPYIVFPGNIGKDDDLRKLIENLEEERKK